MQEEIQPKQILKDRKKSPVNTCVSVNVPNHILKIIKKEGKKFFIPTSGYILAAVIEKIKRSGYELK